MQEEEKRLMRSIPADLARQKVGAHIVMALLVRGDNLLRTARWQNALNCFVGAHFCSDGKSDAIRGKIVLARLLQSCNEEVAAADKLSENELQDQSKRQLTLLALERCAQQLDWIHDNLPQSHAVASLRQRAHALRTKLLTRRPSETMAG